MGKQVVIMRCPKCDREMVSQSFTETPNTFNIDDIPMLQFDCTECGAHVTIDDINVSLRH